VAIETKIKLTTGVIYGVPMDMSDDEIKTCFSDYNVTFASRFFKTINGDKIATSAVKLCFDRQSLPSSVNIDFRSFPVSRYVPPPLRCFHCQKLNHHSSACRNQLRCARCGDHHETADCKIERSSYKCINCGEGHSAGYKGCPKYKQQAQINALVVNDNLSRTEATKSVKSKVNIVNTDSTFQKTKSYASVVSNASTPPSSDPKPAKLHKTNRPHKTTSAHIPSCTETTKSSQQTEEKEPSTTTSDKQPSINHKVLSLFSTNLVENFLTFCLVMLSQNVETKSSIEIAESLCEAFKLIFRYDPDIEYITSLLPKILFNQRTVAP